MNINKFTAESQIVVGGISMQLLHKPIKTLRIVVYPPDGRVRVSAPWHLSAEDIYMAIFSRLSWIKEKQAKFQGRPRKPKQEMLTGESHYIFGREYQLEVIERRGRQEIRLSDGNIIQLFVSPGTDTEKRLKVLTEWYGEQLKGKITDLLNKWQPIIGKQVNDWGIKKMKTKWGSCNITKGRIWLNLELAKKPIECLEYVLVHELVHLWERYHNDRFRFYMDKYLPQWQEYSDILDREPL